MRLLASLRAVKTTLPVHVLVSGYRVPAAEAAIASLGATLLPPEKAPAVHVPAWGSKWARASFAKLRALALTQFDRVVVLDTDSVVLRNIDHLARPDLAAPAFVFGYKCAPRRELRASLMVLRPSDEAWRSALRLARDPRTAIYDDLGEGSVWRHLFDAANELPVGYAALRPSDLPAAEWAKVHALHDPNLLRKTSRAGWREAKMAERVGAIDAEGGRAMDALNLSALLQAAAPARRSKARTKRGSKSSKRRGK